MSPLLLDLITVRMRGLKQQLLSVNHGRRQPEARASMQRLAQHKGGEDQAPNLVDH